MMKITTPNLSVVRHGVEVQSAPEKVGGALHLRLDVREQRVEVLPAHIRQIHAVERRLERRHLPSETRTPVAAQSGLIFGRGWKADGNSRWEDCDEETMRSAYRVA